MLSVTIDGPRSVSFVVAAAVGKLARDEASGRLVWRGSAAQIMELTWYPDATGNVMGVTQQPAYALAPDAATAAAAAFNAMLKARRTRHGRH